MSSNTLGRLTIKLNDSEPENHEPFAYILSFQEPRHTDGHMDGSSVGQPPCPWFHPSHH